LIETKIHKTFYFLIFSLLLLIRITISQDLDSITLSKSYQSQPLKTVLEELENQLNVKFSYLDKHIKGQLVTVHFKNKQLAEALRLILKDTELSFEIYIKSRDIVLYPSRRQSGIEDDLLGYTLKGKVVDKLTEEPLAYANLHLKGTKRGSVSDSSGLFAFLNVSAKTDTLQVHYIGYASKEIPASVSHEKDLLKIKMDQSPLLTEQITITGDKDRSFKISEDQAGRLEFSPLAIDFIPSTGNADFQRTLQLMPGISAGYDKPSELRILGGDRNHNLIFLDGIPVVVKPELYFGMLNPFHQRAIEDVKVYKGGYSAGYGDCLGGVIEMTGNSVQDNQFNFGIGMDPFQVNGFIQIPISKRLKWFFTVNRSFDNIDKGMIYEDIYTAAKEQYVTIHRTVDWSASVSSTDNHYSFIRAMSKVCFEASTKDKFSITFYSGKEKELSETINNTGDKKYQFETTWKWKNTGLSLKWNHRWNSNINSHIAVIYSNEFRPLDYLASRYELSDLQNTSLRGYFYQHRMKNVIVKNSNSINCKWMELDFGGELLKTNFTYEEKNKTERPYADHPFNNILYFQYKRKDEISNAVFYLQTKWNFSRKIDLGLGMRAVNYNVLTREYEFINLPHRQYKPDVNVMPRVSFNLSLSDNLTLNSSWGRYYQYFYTITDLGGEKSNMYDIWWHADEKLPSIYADHTIIKLTYKRSFYRFHIGIYYKNLKWINIHLDNIPFYFNTGQSDMIINEDKDLFYYGSGTAKGIEVSIQKTHGKFTGWFGYNYGKVTQQFPEINNGKPFPPVYHRPHEIKIAACMSIRNWRFTAVGVYASPVQSSESEIVYTNASGITKYDLNLSAYQRMDVNISRMFKNFIFMDWELGISVLNVLNHKTLLSRVIDMDPDSNYQYIRERRMLPFIPLVFLDLRYR
jgi:ferric enterobactin receptor